MYSRSKRALDGLRSHIRRPQLDSRRLQHPPEFTPDWCSIIEVSLFGTHGKKPSPEPSVTNSFDVRILGWLRRPSSPLAPGIPRRQAPTMLHIGAVVSLVPSASKGCSATRDTPLAEDGHQLSSLREPAVQGCAEFNKDPKRGNIQYEAAYPMAVELYQPKMWCRPRRNQSGGKEVKRPQTTNRSMERYNAMKHEEPWLPGQRRLAGNAAGC